MSILDLTFKIEPLTKYEILYNNIYYIINYNIFTLMRFNVDSKSKRYRDRENRPVV